MTITLTPEELQQIIQRALMEKKTVVPDEQPDLRRCLANVMQFKPNAMSRHQLIWKMLQDAWKRNPTSFEVSHGLHTTADGARCYFSVKVRFLSDSTCHCYMHLYGSLRGSMFKVRAVDVFYFEEKYEDVCVWKYASDNDSSSQSGSFC